MEARNYVCAVLSTALTVLDPMDSSPLDSFVHGILQARILEWVAILSSRGSSRPRDPTWVSYVAGRIFTAEPLGKPILCLSRPVQSLSHVRLFVTP